MRVLVIGNPKRISIFGAEASSN